MTLPAFDFLSGPLNYRRRHATIRSEALARAAGLKKGFRPKVLDATAGLGRDSFILASLGCEVWLFERVPAIFARLKAGLEAALLHPELAPVITRMHLSETNALVGLDHPPVVPDVVYLDPMFPDKMNSALPQKSMRELQTLAGKDTDADILLRKAISCATQRVVVKRPRRSPPLAGLLPDFTLKGASSRFDIYLTRNSHGTPSKPDKPDPAS